MMTLIYSIHPYGKSNEQNCPGKNEIRNIDPKLHLAEQSPLEIRLG